MCGLCLVYVQLRNSSSLVIGTVRFVHGVEVDEDVCVLNVVDVIKVVRLQHHR